MAKKKKSPAKKKKFGLKKLWWVIPLLVILGIVWYVFHPVPTPYDREFSYTRDGNLYIYDFKFDTSTEIAKDNGIHDMTWSNNGRFAYIDGDNSLFTIDNVSRPVKLVDGKAKGTFFWDNNGTKVYVTGFPIDSGIPDNEKTAYVADILGKSQQISIDDYNKALDATSNDVILPASFDWKYISHESYFNNKDSQASLFSAPDQQSYDFPSGAWGIQISPESRWAAYKNNGFSGDGNLRIVKWSDAKKGDFSHAVINREAWDYEWIDDNRMLIVQETVNPIHKDTGDDVDYTFTFYVVSLPGGEEKKVYEIIHTQYAYTSAVVAPDRHKFAALLPSDTNSKLVIIDINSSKIIKTIQYDQGYWSNPL